MAELELELCASVYPELTHSTSPAGLTLSLPLAHSGTSCTLHLVLPPAYPASPLTLSLARVRGHLDESSLLTALTAAAAASATPLELCMQAAEAVSAVLPPCAICLEALSGEVLGAPCQHILHRHCGARHIFERVEAFRASAEHAAARAARAAVHSAAAGRIKVAEGAAAFAQAALDACLARVAELRGLVDAASSSSSGGSGSGGGGGSGSSGGGGTAPKRALPPSKARRFEAAEEAAAAEAPPLPLQLERALAEGERLRREAAAAQAKLSAALADASSGGGGGSSSSGGGSPRGSASGASSEDASADKPPLDEHVTLAHGLPLPCPVCRAPLPCPAFYNAWVARHFAALCVPSEEAAAQASQAAQAALQLDGALAHTLKALEQEFLSLWRKQAARGGIIEGARLWR